MADPKTMLVMPGKRIPVSRIVKQAAQMTFGVAFAAAVICAVMVVNGLLSGRGTAMQWVNVWMAFMKRPEILVTMFLTAASTVLFVYWQRDRERSR